MGQQHPTAAAVPSSGSNTTQRWQQVLRQASSATGARCTLPGAGAPSALTRCVTLVFMRLSSWCRFTSSQIALTAATASTKSRAAVEP